MKAIILHLSDSHIQSNNSPVLRRHQLIAATIRPVIASADALFIVFTGDITYSGDDGEFKLADAFLKNMKADLRADFPGPIEMLATPGNHDGMFNRSKSTRNTLINHLRSDPTTAIDDDLVETCTEPLKHYFKFEEDLGAQGMVLGDKLWKEYRYPFGERTVGFSAMNASWASTVPEGDCVFPVNRYCAIQEDGADINILMLHHPLNWYAQSAYHPLRELVKANYQLVMSGHEHTATTNITTDLESSSTIFCEAPALDKDGQSAFSVIVLDVETETLAQESFVWDGQIYKPESQHATWDKTVPIPKRRPKNGFHLTERAKEWLGSLGASFSHPLQEVIQLSDVFVSPDMQELDGEADGQDLIVNAAVLLQTKEQYKKVLIFGDEQFGKTSLLKHFYTEYLRSGWKPLMFDAKEAAVNESYFLRSLDRLVADQYGDEAVHKYAQAPFDEKVALVDNVDAIGSRGDVLARVLKNIEGQFGRIVITAGERFEVSIISSTEATKATADYKDFRMLGFGFKLRHDLVRRWYKIGNQFDEHELQAKVHAADQAINGVLSKGLVPMTAFNTLVLLQTIEVNERGSLANAGTAQYYEYMFRHSLTVAKVKADEIDEIQSYLVHLAWEFFKERQKVISVDGLMKFNQWFSDEMHPTDPLERVKLLEATKILVRRDDGYAFAFRYLEFFFVAKYLAIHSEDQPEIRETIKRLCRHLYLKENANIVLFLTHHMHSNWVIQEIADMLSAILSDIPILNLEQDAAVLNTWVSEKAKILVDTTNVIENNREVRKTDDKAAKLPELMPDQEVSSVRELDQVVQLNLLFKTSEILGQVLKGRYGSIAKDVKLDLVKRLFDAPLRGVSFFSSIINSAPEAILLEITTRLQRNFPSVGNEKLDRVAKRLLFSTLGAVADSFLSRQGEIIGSPKLATVIDQVSENDGSLSYRVFAIASKLSYPGNPPTEDIKALSESLDKNYFGYKLLQGLVARHLYMFHTSHSDKTRLASAVGIDLQTQRDIELKVNLTKKLPGKRSKPHHAQSLLSRLRGSFLMNNGTMISSLEARYPSKKNKKQT